ncbi:Oxalate:formate antiporter isoform 3 [Schistosoma japonicum]|uniref:Oxalate:formate antiporter isoform 3 n=1 Tax=Schistosoma japonicum TaxID=6182 RepID=A0A4Z2DXH7_SCHJA|nr:Oxalate:formate antiporter isoform 3 [Schistosoma japonicum]
MANDRMLLFQGCLSVLGGVLLHLTFGYFYTISNMIPYIMDYLRTYVNPNLSDKDAIWLSALGFCTQGFSMPAGGLVAKKLGFRIVVATSCIFLSGSVFATYFTIQKTFIGVVITYSLTMGIGMGFAYSVVFAIATTWFPEKRGLIVGIIVSGFGLGALVFSPIQTALINPTNIKVDNVTRHFTDVELLGRVPRTLLILGGILLGIQIIGFILLRPRPNAKQPNITQKIQALNDVNVAPKQMIRCIDFYLLWLVMFCNIIPITTITSTYKQFGQKYISDDRFLSAVVTISSLFNCGGRIMWGSVADRFSFKLTKIATKPPEAPKERKTIWLFNIQQNLRES